MLEKYTRRADEFPYCKNKSASLPALLMVGVPLKVDAPLTVSAPMVREPTSLMVAMTVEFASLTNSRFPARARIYLDGVVEPSPISLSPAPLVPVLPIVSANGLAVSLIVRGPVSVPPVVRKEL